MDAAQTGLADCNVVPLNARSLTRHHSYDASCAVWDAIASHTAQTQFRRKQVLTAINDAQGPRRASLLVHGSVGGRKLPQVLRGRRNATLNLLRGPRDDAFLLAGRLRVRVTHHALVDRLLGVGRVRTDLREW